MKPIEFLKNKPKGIGMYSPIYGHVMFSEIKDDMIYVELESGLTVAFDAEGRYDDHGECLLFPSATDRTWSDTTICKAYDFYPADNGSIIHTLSNDGLTVLQEKQSNRPVKFVGKSFFGMQVLDSIEWTYDRTRSQEGVVPAGVKVSIVCEPLFKD